MSGQLQRLRDVQALLSKAREENRSLTDEEQREVRRLMGEDEAEHAMAQRKSRPPLLRDTAQADYLSARLQHLCRLIVRDRRPYCPINGVLLLVPFAGTDTEEDANQTGEVLRRDVTIYRHVGGDPASSGPPSSPAPSAFHRKNGKNASASGSRSCPMSTATPSAP